MRPDKPVVSIKRARRLRKEMSLSEVLLWRLLKGSPGGHKFRKQHPAGPYILDFICPRANLAIEIDGFAHDTAGSPERDLRRDAWLRQHQIDTLRIAANVTVVADSILITVEGRISDFGKTPPSVADATATSPSRVDGEDFGEV
jgi:very-short-patch-repair endonuclease